MSLLYDRKYSLIVGKPKTIIYTGQDTTINLATINVTERTEYVTDYRLEDGSAVEITDLQMVATVSGNSTSSSQSGCVVKVLNLSEETLSIIEQENNYVVLSAGYAQDDELAMIFSGQVFNYTTDKEGENLVTTLHCKEGYTPTNAVRIAKKFVAGLTYADVLLELANEYARNGIPTAQLELESINEFRQTYIQLRTPNETVLKKGFSAVGFLRQIMDNVCESLGYVNYITNGRLFVHPKGFTKTIESYQFTTDQIKSIRRTGSQKGNISTGKGDRGIKITTFLDGRLDTDKRIEILDGTYQGNYKIISKAHTLDYRNGEWTTVVECKEVAV